jgi:hypothetical protein
VGQSPWSNNLWGPGPNEVSILGKGLTRGVQNSKCKAKGAMPLRASSGGEGPKRKSPEGQRPAGAGGGPTHHGRSPARAEKVFANHWWTWHRITCPGAELQEEEAQGLGPNDARIVGKGLGGEGTGVKQEIPVGTSWSTSPGVVLRRCCPRKWHSTVGGEAPRGHPGRPEAWMI